jgi:hypothetical protein
MQGLKASTLRPPMSALGQKQTFAPQKAMSALPPKADMCGATWDVCFGANSGHQNKLIGYSMTWSARATRLGGTARPSALAVFRLITNSYLVGACTGISTGFSPLENAIKRSPPQPQRTGAEWDHKK